MNNETTRRDALARNLAARICDTRRSHDELRVIDKVLSGLELGADVYGPLDVASDSRNFSAEQAMELRDALFYGACIAIAQAERLELEIDLEAERLGIEARR